MKPNNARPSNLLKAQQYRAKAINALKSNNSLLQRWRTYNAYITKAKQA